MAELRFRLRARLRKLASHIWQGLLRNYPAIVIHSILVSVFFLQFLLKGYVMIASDLNPYQSVLPHNSNVSDNVLLFYPLYYNDAQLLKAGQIPLLNRLIAGGVPYSGGAGPIGFLLDPTDLPAFFIPDLAQAFTVTIMLRLFSFGLVTYLCLQSLRISRVPAIFGSCVLTYNAGTALRLMMPGNIEIALFVVPAIFLFLASLRRQSWRFAILSGIILGYSWNLDFSELSYYALLVMGLMLIWAVFTDERKLAWFRTAPRKILLFCAALASAFGVGSSAIYNIIVGVNLGIRSSSYGISGFSPGYLPLVHLLDFLTPNFFGSPVTGTYWGGLGLPSWANYIEFVHYAGIITILLSFLTLISIRDNFNAFSDIYFFGVIGGLGFLLALGSTSPIFWLTSHVPFLYETLPMRALQITDISLAVMSAFGLQLLLDSSPVQLRRRVLVTLGFATILAIGVGFSVRIFEGYLSSPQVLYEAVVSNTFFFILLILSSLGLLSFELVRKRDHTRLLSTLVAGFLILIMVDLSMFGAGFGTFVSPTTVYPRDPALAYLNGQTGPFRVAVIGNQYQANGLMPYNLEDARGYWPAVPTSYLEVSLLAEGAFSTDNGRIFFEQYRDSPVWDLLNVKYLIVPSVTSSALQFQQGLELVYSSNLLLVYQRTAALSRAFIVHKVIVTKSSDQDLMILNNSTFSPGRTATVSFEPCCLAQNQTRDDVQMLSYSSDGMTLSLTTSSPGILIITNTYVPGWSAAIDNVQSQIFVTDHAFIGLLVQSGTHSITLSYREPTGFLTVANGSVVALGIFIAFCLEKVGKNYLRRRIRR